MGSDSDDDAIGFSPLMDAQEWKKFILEWSTKVQAQNLEECGGVPRSCDPEHGFGSQGASEEMLAAVESRLGVTLPHSYRQFLKATNGLEQPVDQMAATGGDYCSAEEIDWFHVKNSEWIQIWTKDADDVVSDEEYFDYSKDQDSCNLRVEYLNTALEISRDGDAGVYLLIPDVKDKSGEWEAWHFASWLPGAARYRSFEEMMKDHYQDLIDNEDPERCFGF